MWNIRHLTSKQHCLIFLYIKRFYNMLIAHLKFTLNFHFLYAHYGYLDYIIFHEKSILGDVRNVYKGIVFTYIVIYFTYFTRKASRSLTV